MVSFIPVPKKCDKVLGNLNWRYDKDSTLAQFRLVGELSSSWLTVKPNKLSKILILILLH